MLDILRNLIIQITECRFGRCTFQFKYVLLQNQKRCKMNNAVIFKTIDEYNKTMGVETLHPLVTVVDLSKSTYLGAIPDTHTYQFFTVFLKDIHCADIIYGRNTYDYQEGTLVFLGPNQTIKLVNRQPHQPKGWALMFHPDLLRGTSLSGAIKDYSFFSYNVHEALHISQQERAIVLECFQNIENELHRGIDKLSHRPIVSGFMTANSSPASLLKANISQNSTF